MPLPRINRQPSSFARTALKLAAVWMLAAGFPLSLLAQKDADTTSSLTISGGDVISGNWLTFDDADGEATLTVTTGPGTQALLDTKVRLASDLLVSNDLTGYTLTFGTVFQGGTDGAMNDVTVLGAGNVAFGQNIANVDAFTYGGTGTLTFGGTTTLGSLTLSGGLIELSTSHLTVGTLTITGDTIIDFGTHGESFLAATDITIAEGATLTLRNWTEAADYFYATNPPGATTLAAVNFEGYGAGSAWTAYDSQVSPFQPVPEPATYGALCMGAMLGTFWWRRRRA